MKNTLHFKGVVITDDLQMKAIADHYGLEAAVIDAVNAGADILVFSEQFGHQDPSQIVNIIFNAVKQGKIKRERILDAYRHAHLMKQKLS